MTDLQAHLLVVDDDERIRGLLQKFLIRSGFLVTTARNAAQVRRLLGGLDFDLLVLDVMMPGEDGITLTRDLRRTGSRGWRRGQMTIWSSRSNPRNCCCASTPFCAGCRR